MWLTPIKGRPVAAASAAADCEATDKQPNILFDGEGRRGVSPTLRDLIDEKRTLVLE